MNFPDAAAVIRRAENVLVSTHTNPDGDAVGSLLGMGSILRRLGKRSVLFLDSEIPEHLRFLPHADDIQRRLDTAERFDLAVVLDCGLLSRIGGMDTWVAAIPAILNVDHHLFNTLFGTVNLVDTDYCATTAILMDLFKSMGLSLEGDVAEDLYTGILTDTGSFRYGNTTGSALRMAAELVDLGVKPAYVAREIYLHMPMQRLHLLERALKSLRSVHDGRIGVMALTREDFQESGTAPSDVEGFIDYVRSLPGVEVAVLLKEVDGGQTTSVSLRSWGNTNVAAIAKTFDGGGHRNAAGFRLQGRARDREALILSAIASGLDGDHGALAEEG